jgi:hypothetical protein
MTFARSHSRSLPCLQNISNLPYNPPIGVIIIGAIAVNTPELTTVKGISPVAVLPKSQRLLHPLVQVG